MAFTQGAATDGTLAAGTVNNILGPMWRVKYSSTGTYAPSPGSITFSQNPVPGSSIVLGGTTVGFVNSGPVGNQVASPDPNLSKSSYSASATVLTVTYNGVLNFPITASTSPASNGTAISAGGITRP